MVDYTKRFEADDFDGIDLPAPVVEKPGARETVYGMRDVDPDQYAKADAVARTHGVTIEVAKESAKELDYSKRFTETDFESLSVQSPTVSKWLQEPRNAGKAHDDIKELSSVEIGVNSFRRGQLGLAGIPASFGIAGDMAQQSVLKEAGRLADEGVPASNIRARLGLVASEFAALPPEDRRQRLLALDMQAGSANVERLNQLAILSEQKKKYPSGGDLSRLVESDSLLEQIGIVLANPLDVGLDIGLESAVVTLPGIIAAPLAGPAAVAAGSGLASLGPAMLESLERQGFDISTRDGVRAALADESVMEKAVGDAAAYSGSVAFLDLLSAGIAGKVMPFGRRFSEIATRTEGKIITGRQAAGNVAAEIGAQGALGGAGEAMGQAATGQEFDSTQILLEVLGEALVGTPMEGAAMALHEMKSRREAATWAGRQREYLAELTELSKATKLLGRDASALSSLITQMAEEGGSPSVVYVDSLDLRQALLQSDMTLPEFADLLPDSRQAVVDAMMTGGVVEIPIGEAVTKISGSKIDQALMPYVRLEEDGFSKAEAEEFVKSYEDRQVAGAQEILAGMAEDSEFRKSTAELRNRVAKELVDTGRLSPDAARNSAELTTAFFVRAARDWQATDKSMTPGKLFSRFYGDAPMVVGSQVSGDQLQQGEIKTDQFRAWFGDSKIVDADGKPLVVYHETDADITEFRISDGKRSSADGEMPTGVFFKPHGRDIGVARGGAVQMPVYLSIQNPLHVANRAALVRIYSIEIDGYAALVDQEKEINGRWKADPRTNWATETEESKTDFDTAIAEWEAELDAVAAQQKTLVNRFFAEKGYDGLIVEEDQGSIGRSTKTIVAFRPEQIKSAIGNRGTFDPNDPNILRQDEGGVDRRGGIGRRASSRGDRRVTNEQLFDKPVSAMNADEKGAVIEELRVQLLVSDLTGLGSKLAWQRERAKNPKRFVASIDADGLAWVNDTMGHESGDALLAIIGDAFAESGVTAYHISGDEFWMQGDDDVTLRNALEAARQKVNSAVVSSDKWSVTGQSFSYGISEEPKVAEEELQREKAERQSAGLRAERKTRPAGARAVGEPGFVPGEAAADAERTAGARESSLGQDAAGSTRGAFVPSTGTIALLSTSNLSTFLHESAHQFLDLSVKMAMMPDAPPGIVKRAADAMAWLGVTGDKNTSAFEAWTNMSIEDQRPFHEKWAETFEQYIIKGQAPSLDMARVFDVFASWMLSIYKSMKRFAASRGLASLDPEVSIIFDKMLATEEEIAEAKSARAVIPLFTEKPASMSEDDWRKYLADIAAEDLHAQHVIDRKKLNDLRWQRNKAGKLIKELQKDVAEKRQAMRVSARREVLSNPAYMARRLLTRRVPKEQRKKKDIESRLLVDVDETRDSAAIAIAKAGGMNRESVVAEYGIDAADFDNMRAGDLKGATVEIEQDVDGETQKTKRTERFKRPVLVKKGGMTAGEVGEFLAELGYIPVDANGKFDNRDVEAILHGEASGSPQYSIHADWEFLLGDGGFSKSQIISDENDSGIRLQRSEIVSLFGPDVADALGDMVSDVGVSVDYVAGQFGFQSAEEFMVALSYTKDINAAIEEVTDRMMLEAYGDISSPQALQRQVDLAIMSASRSRIVASEIAIESMMMGKPSRIVRAAKEAAIQIVGRLKVSAVRPDKYRLAATRAAKAAQSARAKGDTALAVSSQRARLLNMELFNAADEARVGIDKSASKMLDMFRGKDDDIAKRRNMDIVRVVRAVLAGKGIGTEKAKGRAIDHITTLLQYEPDMAAQIQSIIDMMPDVDNYKDMTVSEFRAFSDLIESIWSMSASQKRIDLGYDSVLMEEAEQELIADAKVALGGDIPRSRLLKGTANRFDKFIAGARGVKAMIRRVESWCDLAGPSFTKYIFTPVSVAITKHKAYRKPFIDRYVALLRGIEKTLDFRPIAADELNGYVFKNGKIDLLHAILHAGNASNKRKLLVGYEWADIQPDGSISTENWDKFIKRMWDSGIITKADMDFVQSVWDLLEEMKPDAQKAHHKMYGYYFDEITANEVVTPFGTYRGGYVPAIADRNNPDVAPKVEAEELLHAGNSFIFPTTGRGFTKGRTELNKPLELDLRTIGSHIDKVSRFINMEPVIRDVVRLVKRKDFSAAANAMTEGAVNKMLIPWLQRSARQTVAMPGKYKQIDSFFGYLRRTAGASIMMGNVINTLQQATGLSVAAVEVPAPFLLRALKNYTSSPKITLADIISKSEWMSHRLSGSSFDMQSQIESIMIGPGVVGDAMKAREFLLNNAYFMQQAMQNQVDCVVWLGAYDHALSQGVEPEDAILVADSKVRLTQGSFAPEDIADFENATPFVRIFFQFAGYFNMLANVLGNNAAKAMREAGFWRKSTRLTYVWFVGLAVPAVIAQAIAQGLPDDEDDEDGDGVLDEYLAMFFSAQQSVLAAMAPGVGQVYMTVFNQFDEKTYNDRLNISPPLTYLATALTGSAASKALAEAAAAEDATFVESIDKREVRDALTLISLVTGLPTGQIGKTAGYALDVAQENVEPESAYQMAAGLARGR